MKKLIFTLGFITSILFGNFNASAQSLSVTPGTLNIGPVIVGQTSADGAHSFTVTGSGFNPGQQIYTDSQDSHFMVSLTGGAGTYSSTLIYNADGAGNVAQIIYVNYTPTVTGFFPATVLVYEFQAFNFIYKNVQGIGQGPEMLLEGRPTVADPWTEIVNNETTPSVSQGTDFGDALIGVETVDRTYQITNTSTGGFSADLVLTEYVVSKYVKLTGVNADQFSVTLEPTTPISASGGTTTYTIHFNPTSTGVKNATVSIINNDPNENPYVYAIQGTGTIIPPGVPTATAATSIDNNSFVANWTVGGGGPTDGYFLYVATDAGFTSMVSGYNGLDVGLVTTYNVVGVVSNTTYYYRLKAYNISGKSLNSNTISLITAPPVPTILAATNIDVASFYANWSFVSSATSYRLDVNTLPDFTGTVVLSDQVVSNNYYYVVGLTGGTTYYYKVRSYNGNSSENSGTNSAVTICNAPVATDATAIGSTDFTANWNAPTGGAPDFYKLDVSIFNNFATYVPGYENLTVSGGTSKVVSGLTPNKQYFFRVRATNVSGNSASSNVINLYTYSSSATSTWTGSVSSEWYNPSNWDNGIPSPTTNAIIADVTTQPVVASNYSCNNLTINPLADLTVNNGITLTVNANLLIQSDATGTGSVLEYGGLSVTGTQKVEFYITQNRWHFVSSPLTSALAGVYEDIYLRFYDEPNMTWTDIVSLTDPLVPGRGYVAWSTPQYLGNTTVIYSGGSLNSGTVTSPVTNLGDGWNLAGNPYPSAIDWDNAGWIRTNLDASVYVWDGVQYLVWNGSLGTLTDGVIPAYQAYYTKATLGVPSLQVGDAARVLGAQAYKSDEVSNLITVQVNGNGYNDVAYINFNENATPGFDPEYDAYKLFGIDEAPQIYSILDDEIATINTLPAYTSGMIIPMGLKVGVDGVYNIRVSNLGSFDFPINVFIEDTQTGDMVEMSNENQFAVNASTNDKANRFILHFSILATGLDEGVENSNPTIYSNRNVVYVQNLLNDNKTQINIYNISGQQIYSGLLEGNSLNRIPLATKPGYYVVKVMSDNMLKTQKVFIQ